MSLRAELEAMLEEFEHFAYEGAPLDVAVDKVREILDRTKPKVLTTLEELDSEEASKALSLIPNDGSGFLSFYQRLDGKNDWTGPCSDHFHSSAELLADFVLMGIDPEFIVVNGPDDVPATPRRVLTTVEDLDSEEASKALCLVPGYRSGILGFYRRTPDGQNEWTGMGTDNYFTSAELLADCANKGDEPSFTLIPREP